MTALLLALQLAVPPLRGFDQSMTRILTWKPVAGAVSYIVVDDHPPCCDTFEYTAAVACPNGKACRAPAVDQNGLYGVQVKDATGFIGPKVREADVSCFFVGGTGCPCTLMRADASCP